MALGVPGLFWSADPEPITIRLGPLSLTPSGFLESITVVRSTTTHDDVSTRFGAIPLAPGPVEALDSFRNSRIALDGQMALGPGTLSGYLETDFLNRPPQPPYRFRQYFGRYTIGGWEFSAGQEWSLLRPNRRGLSTETDLLNTRVVDAGYHVGLLGYRNRQARVARRKGTWTAALGYENGRDWLPTLIRDTPRLHWEVVGVAGRHHYGAAASATVHATRRIDLVTQQSRIQGGGKDALGTLPTGTPMTATLGGIEARLGKRFLVYGYGGAVWGGRSGGNRRVAQWSAGFSRELLRDRYGLLSAGAEVSRVSRRLWDGPDGSQVFTMISIRRTLGPAR